MLGAKFEAVTADQRIRSKKAFIGATRARASLSQEQWAHWKAEQLGLDIPAEATLQKKYRPDTGDFETVFIVKEFIPAIHGYSYFTDGGRRLKKKRHWHTPARIETLFEVPFPMPAHAQAVFSIDEWYAERNPVILPGDTTPTDGQPD